MAETGHSLLRALTLTDAIALFVGTVIGTGVLLKTAMMTQPGVERDRRTNSSFADEGLRRRDNSDVLSLS